jgi:hypothetical protein
MVDVSQKSAKQLSIRALMVLVVIFGFVFGWFAHRTRVRQALAALENANLTREVAEIAVVEYAEGIFLQDLATVQREISSAETALRLAEEQLDRSKRIGGGLRRARS